MTTVGGDEYRFLVDTGIGITVVSSALAARSDVRLLGETFTGQRMSGQSVETPLVRMPATELGDYTVDAHIAGVADLGDIDGPMGFAGILDTRFVSDCGVDLDSPDVTTRTGTDDTGYQWTRHWVTIEGSVHLAAAPETAQDAPRVQFQSIIHDGLVGAGYLERYRLSFDVSGARMVLGRRL